MPALLSHYRPDAMIFAFTEARPVQRRLALYHGVTALHMEFGHTADETFDRRVPMLHQKTRLVFYPGFAGFGRVLVLMAGN